MGRRAFIFPGQGAQYPGMGKDFYEKERAAREIFDKASSITGLDLPAICFTENPRLDATEYTQIAMLTVEVAILKVLEERGIFPDVTAGLSLGEYGRSWLAKRSAKERLLQLSEEEEFTCRKRYLQAAPWRQCWDFQGKRFRKCAAAPGDLCLLQIIIALGRL